MISLNTNALHDIQQHHPNFKSKNVIRQYGNVINLEPGSPYPDQRDMSSRI